MGKITDCNYRQCSLERIDGATTLKTTSWLPEKYAKKSRLVDLKGDDGEWTRNWVVTSVGSTSIDGDMANSRSRAWAKHREATDI